MKKVTKMFLLGIALVVASPKAEAYYYNLPRDYQTAVDEYTQHYNSFYIGESDAHGAIGDASDGTGNLGDDQYYSNLVEENYTYWSNYGDIFYNYFLWFAYLDPANFYAYWELAYEYNKEYSEYAYYQNNYDPVTMDYVYSSDYQGTVDLLNSRDAARDAYFAEPDASYEKLLEVHLDCSEYTYNNLVDDWYALGLYEYDFYAFYGIPNYAISAYYYFLGKYCDAVASGYSDIQYDDWSLDSERGDTTVPFQDAFGAGEPYDYETVSDIYGSYASFCEAYAEYYADLANYYGV